MMLLVMLHFSKLSGRRPVNLVVQCEYPFQRIYGNLNLEVIVNEINSAQVLCNKENNITKLLNK